MFKRNRSVYLDHAAATPVDLSVQVEMKTFLSDQFYNPSSLYRESLEVQKSLNDYRERVAKILKCRPQEIIFTNGGTESNNLAIQGVVHEFLKKNTDVELPKFHQKPHVIISAIEHEAVRETARALLDQNKIELTELPVSEQGIVDVKILKESLQENTILVSIMYANNEIGTVQPIRDIAKTLRWFKKQINSNYYPLLHTDAIQAVNYCDMNAQRLGVDLMTVSAAKMYGPKGIALLYKKDNVELEPVIFGGGQEKGLRSGTENMSLIAGLTKALEITENMKEKETARLKKLQDCFFEKLSKLKTSPYASLRSDRKNSKLIINGSREERLPNNINISVPGISGEQLVIELDARGVMCSSQSACSSRDEDESYVIKALRSDADTEAGSLRFTMGRSTTKKDVDFAVSKLEEVLEKVMETQKRFG